jgi:hypothetical protein
VSEELLVDLFFDRFTLYLTGFMIGFAILAITVTAAQEAIKTWQHGRRERAITEQIRQRVTDQQLDDYYGSLRRQGTGTRGQTGAGDRQSSGTSTR